MSETAESKVVRNDELSRYEVWHGPDLAGFSVYEERGDDTVFTHTEVDDAFAGKGMGKLLAKHAVADVIARNRVIVPLCPFIKAYLDKNPEYAEHVR